MRQRRRIGRGRVTTLAIGLGTVLPALVVSATPPGLPGLPGVRAARPLAATDLVSVTLAADVPRIEPGSTFFLAVTFEIKPHWHIYWLNPGDAGLPTDLAVRAPTGFEIGPTIYPRPEAFDEPDGRTFGYQKDAVLFVPVTAPESLTPRPVVLEVEASFLVCRGRCLSGEVTRSITLPAGGAPVATDPSPKRFGARKDRLPRLLRELPGSRAVVDLMPDGRRGRLVVIGPTRGFSAVTFFPFESPGVTIGDIAVVLGDHRFELTVPFEASPQNALGRIMRVGGVIGLGTAVDEPSYWVRMPVDPQVGAPD